MIALNAFCSTILIGNYRKHLLLSVIIMINKTHDNMKYLIGKKKIKGLTPDSEIVDVTQEEKYMLNSFSKKEIAVRSEGLIISDNVGNIILDEKKRYSQHFFPLSIVDYAEAMYSLERHGRSLPILSIDSHDTLECDFRCKDCLSGGGKNAPIQNYPQGNFDMQPEFYKHILKEIADYSAERGFVGVRFEQSGEGNPDYYKYRPEVLDFAKQELGLGIVYVTTGSKMEASLRHSLIKNADFIRISFPGIGKDSYSLYSRQNKFTYNDSMENIKRIIDERRESGRERDLMIGARVALRPEHEGDYVDFAKEVKEIGMDTLQIVKILIPDRKKLEDHPLSPVTLKQLKEVQKLDDETFNVVLPHKLDYMYYDRIVNEREEFPKQCFSALIQPVIFGKSLFVCTKSEVMYSQEHKLGTFEGAEGEIKGLLSEENVRKATRNIPAECKTCSSIYDNILMHSLQNIIRTTNSPLDFYEVIR